ncbi:MAG: transcription termination/antitermination protein NusA, partial [Parvibaculum sp.]
VKTVEDLAGCATDDLLGWNETVNGERKHQQGIVEGFDLTAEDANDLIMRARLKAGWITEADLASDEGDEDGEEADEVGEEA